ncbi:MAG TPA: DNA polymerase III subunit gamma/tau [Dongiaceae bacterium]|nr:DNA polymerase III subunit gamma/tau [Dongiaceae bacterium]
MSQALYRKYRSKSLAEVVGQSHITDILTRALKSGRIAHAYLFTGPRGVGKTSIARILAHEINNLPYTDDSQHLDIIEIDAASNNGVEDVRDLREKVQLAPVSAAKKIYIIDEVHMLSKPAFNALLKTLEEPPEHVVFILATTDVDKLPATIVSRTQRYGFRAIAPADAVSHLKHIAKQEKISISDDALQLIAERGDGSFRDSISLLDQLASLAGDGEKITVPLIEASLGLAPAHIIDTLLDAVGKHDVRAVATILLTAESDGISPVVLTNQLISSLRSQAVEKPQLLGLLDALLDVAKSSQPSVKLLSVLGTAAADHKPKSAALSMPVLEVSATIEELEQQATKRHPKLAEKPQATTALSQHLQVQEKPQAEASPKPKKAPKGAEKKPFDWAAVIEHARVNHLALYSVLSKCTPELAENDLTLYANNAFYKKKLDDPKYLTHLYECLEACGVYSLTIHTLPTGAPMKSSQAAAIADIMGGGIEVSPEAA